MMNFDTVLKLTQKDLYDKAREVLLPHLQSEVNEHDLARIIEQKVRHDRKTTEYVKVLQWMIGYQDFKDTKSHHKATRDRYQNAKEVACWFAKTWHESEHERQVMTEGLTMASADVRIKAALIVYETTGIEAIQIEF